MSINFCHPGLNPSLSCSTVCRDGYEVTNLNTEDPSQQKGFLADYFMKPPVSVSIKFACDINVSHVIIHPRVGTQKSIGFELYASRETRNCDSEQRLISIGYIHDSEDVIIFSRRRQLEGPQNLFNVPYSQHLFYSRAQDFVNSIKIITVKITKTLHSTVPSLKKIEVWGKPSSTCASEVRKKIEKLWTDCSATVTNEEFVDSKPRSEICDILDIDNDNSELIIPEEFIDVITFNIMMQPMSLPSGKVVDQLTLEKCARADAQNGRQPSDPFTGEVFTAQRKPVFLLSLKSRIDKFLSDNAHHKSICNTSRTVGKKKFLKDKAVKKVSNKIMKINHCGSNYPFQNTPSGASNSYHSHQEEIVEIINCAPNCCKDDSPENVSLNRNPKQVFNKIEKALSQVEVINIDDQDSDEIIDLSDDKDDDSDATPRSSSLTVADEPGKTESNHLDTILQKTLIGLPSFLQATNQNTLKPNVCSNCSSDSNLYLIPCSHISCRSCLFPNIKNLKVTCQACKLDFESSKLVRFHQ